MMLSLKGYYSQQLDDVNMNLDCFKNNDCRDLIEEKYNRIGKKMVFTSIKDDDKKIFEKSAHMVSVYFLGILLQNIFESHIKENIKNLAIAKMIDETKIENMVGYHQLFEYLWRLSSLYHDIASYYEKNNCVNKTCFKGLDGNELIKKCIDDQFGYSIKELILESKFNFTHTPTEITNYFSLMFNKMLPNKRTEEVKPKLEHGILAGCVLYDILLKNLIAKLGGNEECNINDLVWDINDKLLYMYAADAIIVHNMWYRLRDDSNALEYEDNGLSNLIYDPNGEKDNRLNMNDNPLAFLLGLVDTIEPIKYFCVVYGSKKDEIDKEKIIPTLRDIFIQVDLEIRVL